MSIVKLLSEETVFPALSADTKEELLNTMVDSFQSAVNEKELEQIRTAVLEREKIMSTGVGKGLAIPHGKAAGITNNFAAFALLDEPIDYEAIDDQPVSMVFLLVGPEHQNSMHIKMLSRISRLMNNPAFRDKLSACSTAEEILQTFEEGDIQG